MKIKVVVNLVGIYCNNYNRNNTLIQLSLIFFKLVILISVSHYTSLKIFKKIKDNYNHIFPASSTSINYITTVIFQ